MPLLRARLESSIWYLSIVINSFIGIEFIRDADNIVSSILLKPNLMFVPGIYIDINLGVKD